MWEIRFYFYFSYLPAEALALIRSEEWSAVLREIIGGVRLLQGKQCVSWNSNPIREVFRQGWSEEFYKYSTFPVR